MAFCMKINLLIRAIRLRREEIEFHEDEGGSASVRAKLLKHKKNFERTTRAIQGRSACMHACMHVCVLKPSCEHVHA